MDFNWYMDSKRQQELEAIQARYEVKKKEIQEKYELRRRAIQEELEMMRKKQQDMQAIWQMDQILVDVRHVFVNCDDFVNCDEFVVDIRKLFEENSTPILVSDCSGQQDIEFVQFVEIGKYAHQVFDEMPEPTRASTDRLQGFRKSLSASALWPTGIGTLPQVQFGCGNQVQQMLGTTIIGQQGRDDNQMAGESHLPWGFSLPLGSQSFQPTEVKTVLEPNFDLLGKSPESNIHFGREEIPLRAQQVVENDQEEEVAEAKLKLILRLWKRRSSKLRDLREQKQLAANAALYSLSLGPPIRQSKDQQSTSEGEKIHQNSQVAHRAAGPWLLSKLMPATIDDDLVISSPGLSLWRKWIPSWSNADLTYCLSVIKDTNFDDLNETISGATAVLFLVPEDLPWELQMIKLHNLLMSLPSGSCVPLLILSSSYSVDVSDPSFIIIGNLGLHEMDKSRVSSYMVVFLVGNQLQHDRNGFTDKYNEQGIEVSVAEEVAELKKLLESETNRGQAAEEEAHQKKKLEEEIIILRSQLLQLTTLEAGQMGRGLDRARTRFLSSHRVWDPGIGVGASLNLIWKHYWNCQDMVLEDTHEVRQFGIWHLFLLI